MCDCHMVGHKFWLFIYYFITQIYATWTRDILGYTMMTFKLRNEKYKYINKCILKISVSIHSVKKNMRNI